MKQTGVTSLFKSGTWADISLCVLVSIACAGLTLLALPQDAIAQVSSGGVVDAAPVIPQQVRYAGKLATRTGDTVEAVFSIYAAPEGGEPLWTETQKVAVDVEGSYTVLLGSVSQAGVPQTLFAGGAARWLGVSVERAPELERALLSSVPYAMKSADAQALAGHPAADFVTQGQLSEQFSQFSEQHTLTPATEFQPLTGGTITGSGTTGAIPEFTGANTIGNSEMVQVGSDIGINEATPVATLDVNGTSNLRGTQTFPALATATTAAGQHSQVTQWSASAWSSAANAPINQTFRMFSFPEGNNTATPSGDFIFQYQLGTVDTNVFSISSNGLMTSYGGLNITPPNVATSSAALNSPPFELGGSSYSSASSNAVHQNFAWQVVPTGNNTSTPSSNLALLYGSGFNPLAATGLSISPAGVINWATGQTFPGTGAGTITGITTTSPLTGGGTSGSVAVGLNESTLTSDIAPSLETTFDSRYAKLSGGNIFSGLQEATQTAGPGNSALLGWGTNGSVGAYSYSDTGYGVEAESTSGYGVYSYVGNPVPGSAGILGFTGNEFSSAYDEESNFSNAGIWADNSGAGTGIPVSLIVTGDDVYGAVVVTNSVDYPGLVVNNRAGTAAQFVAKSGFGVSASTYSGTGVLGIQSSNSNTYNQYTGDGLLAGVWGDSSVLAGTGVNGTADNAAAANFINNSPTYHTLYIINNSTGGTGAAVLSASTPNGSCDITDGNFACTGQLKTLASVDGGARKMETYAPQSAENWMEDYGTGTMRTGVAVVKIDPAFAKTVSETPDYHVFITPNADANALYVINKTATSFEVRESKGGISSMTFDYKVVARRRGYEQQRLVDVTARFNEERARSPNGRAHGAPFPATSPSRVHPAHPVIQPHGNGVLPNGVQANKTDAPAPVRLAHPAERQVARSSN